MREIMKLSKLKQMRLKVLKELEHIPDWLKLQKDLRIAYWFLVCTAWVKKQKLKSAKSMLFYRSICKIFYKKGI